MSILHDHASRRSLDAFWHTSWDDHASGFLAEAGREFSATITFIGISKDSKTLWIWLKFNGTFQSFNHFLSLAKLFLNLGVGYIASSEVTFEI